MKRIVSLECTFDNETGLINQRLISEDDTISLEEAINIISFTYRLYTKDAKYLKIMDDLIYFVVSHADNIADATFILEQIIGGLTGYDFIKVVSSFILNGENATCTIKTEGKSCDNKNILAFIIFTMIISLNVFNKLTIDDLFSIIKSKSTVMDPVKVENTEEINEIIKETSKAINPIDDKINDKNEDIKIEYSFDKNKLN